MKTAKKLLALVLVIVMAVGLTSFAAAKDAATYTDIENVSEDAKVALYVLSAIGILEGFEDGSFGPKGSFTREQAAKIITWLLVGPSADRLPSIDTGFSDVKATDWSAKYIAYCVSQGVIYGYGDGTFGPKDAVTDIQFAAMLLRILGGSGYEGAGWEMRVFADATGGFQGIDILEFDIDVTQSALRENVAVYAFNALKFVKDAKTTIVTKYQVVKVASPASAFADALDDLADDLFDSRTDAILTVSNMNLGLAYGDDYTVVAVPVPEVSGTTLMTKFNLKPVDAPDAFGRPTRVAWYVGSKRIITEAGADPVITYTKSTKETDIYKDLALTANATATIKVDGASKGSTTLSATATATVSSLTATGNGVLTEVYKTATGYSIIIVNTYLAAVTGVTAATATAPRMIKLTVYYLDAANDPATSEIEEYETDDYAMGDFLLITATALDDPDAIQSIKEAPLSEDTAVTRFSSTSVTFGGAAQSYAKLFAFGEKTGYSFTATYDFFLDDYGYVIGRKTFSAGIDALNYIYVNNAVVTEFDGGELTGASARIQIAGFYMDGTRVVMDVKIPVVAGKPVFTIGTGLTAIAYDLTVAGTKATLEAALKLGVLFSYKIDDDKIVLSNTLATTGTPPTVAKTSSAITLEKGRTNVVGITDAFANSTTSVVYVNTAAANKVGKLVGVANFPDPAFPWVSPKVVYVTTGNVISDILIIADNAPTAAKPAATAYAVYTGAFEETSDGSEYLLFVDGVLKSYVVSDDSEAEPDNNPVEWIYGFATDADGLALLSEDYEVAVKRVKITAVTSSFFVYDDGGDDIASSLFASNYKVYDVSGTTFGEGTLAKDKWVVAIEDHTGITAVYIVPGP